ncbi:hypothetical protein GCM10010405_06040 [Streptomyces macrosporus]|uniref:Uncharacterized protein n=1 Tax=Streptomyces macrosporus TaxID=44032 RepID=A0ABN3JD77_9ACTN
MTGLLVIGGLGTGFGSIGWAVFTDAPAWHGWAGATAGLVLFLAGGAVAPEVEEEASPSKDGDGWWADGAHGQRAGGKDTSGGSGCGAVTGGDGGGCGAGCGGCGCGG